MRIRQEDTAARLGGDEFCIVAGEMRSADDALRLGETLLAAVREPLAWSGREIRIGGSLGIALYPDHGDVPEALLGHADHAMYAAKADGRNRVRMAALARLPGGMCARGRRAEATPYVAHAVGSILFRSA